MIRDDAYFQPRAVEPERYNSMITLLQSFADQLSHHAESLAVIEEGSEPAEIAFEVGYQSLSQFNRSFARIVGSSPTTWRRERFAEV